MLDPLQARREVWNELGFGTRMSQLNNSVPREGQTPVLGILGVSDSVNGRVALNSAKLKKASGC